MNTDESRNIYEMIYGPEEDEIHNRPIDEHGIDVIIDNEQQQYDEIRVKKDAIEKEIIQFKGKYEELQKEYSNVRKLVYREKKLSSNFDIDKLVNMCNKLFKDSSKLKKMLDDIKETTFDSNLSFELSYLEVDNIPREIGKNISNLKTDYLALFKWNILEVNDRIDYLKNIDKNSIDAQIYEKIQNLSFLEVVENKKIRSFRDKKYFDEDKYKMFLETSKIVGEIEELLNIKQKNTDLDVIINGIRKSLEELTFKIEENISSDEVREIETSILTLENQLKYFQDSLEQQKDTLDENKIKAYIDIYNFAVSKIEQLRLKLDNSKTIENKLKASLRVRDNDIKALADRINNILDEDVQDFSNNLFVWRKSIETLKFSLEDLEKEINDSFGKDDFVDINKKKIMLEEIKKHSENIVKIENKLDKIEMLVNKNSNYNITDFENIINDLKKEVSSLDKSDKKKRKEIRKKIAVLDKKIHLYEKGLNLDKESNLDKYNELSEKLKIYKTDFDQVKKEFNGKYPLAIRGIREVGRFYKKHPKLTLISAGLTAVGLTHATIGPLLIPAIMNGNMILGGVLPFLKPVTNFFNNILGALINATLINGSWHLANGMTLTSSSAVTSLLKGLAVCGTPPLVAGVVVSIKKLIDKIKLKELKISNKKISSVIGKGKKLYNDTKEKVTSKISGLRNYDEEKIREYRIDYLIDEYENSGIHNLELFAEMHNLTNDEIDILRENVREKRGR